MMQIEFDWKSGVVALWDLDCVDDTRPVCEQSDNLKEDLAQIVFPNETLLDVGWYPSFDTEGEFVVTVIRNGDWETPSFRTTAKDILALSRILSSAISNAAGNEKAETETEEVSRKTSAVADVNNE